MKFKRLLITFILMAVSIDFALKNKFITVEPIFYFDSPIPSLFSAEGICLFPFIFLKNKINVYVKRDRLEEIVIHEMIHFGQVLENGFFGFYLKYLFYWMYYIYKEGYKESYYFIPYEIEAYKLDKLKPNIRQNEIILNLKYNIL